jgi:hypothetical protein
MVFLDTIRNRAGILLTEGVRHPMNVTNYETR